MNAPDAHAVLEGLALFALCRLLAQVEIEIEGEKGWAADLPTWRWGPEWWLNLTNGKEVTGYHLWLTLFLIGIFHLPLVFAGFSRELWAKCASSYLLITAVWDLQWFSWNPAWGLTKFRATPIPWFRRKLLGFRSTITPPSPPPAPRPGSSGARASTLGSSEPRPCFC